MMHRLLPAGLFAAAAALYWILTVAALRVVGAFQFRFEFPADDGCGGSCTIYVALPEALGLTAVSAAAVALVAALIGPWLVALYHDRTEFAWWASVWITTGAYVLVFFGILLAIGLTSPAEFEVSWQTPFGLLFLSPFLLTALPFGMGTARVWHRLGPSRPGA